MGPLRKLNPCSSLPTTETSHGDAPDAFAMRYPSSLLKGLSQGHHRVEDTGDVSPWPTILTPLMFLMLVIMDVRLGRARVLGRFFAYIQVIPAL